MNELDKLLKLIRHIILGFVWCFFVFAVLSLLVTVFFLLRFCSS